MHRSTFALGILVAASALALVGEERDARACGGCFHPPTQTVSDITDERMLLSVSPTQTTLYDQIEYSGNPSSFAWVLPINGTVTVGLSADVLFDSVDALTATQITPPLLNCPAAPDSCRQSSVGCGASDDDSAASGFAGPNAAPPSSVTVTKQQNVGPYETVQLTATDPNALNDWLTQNDFTIPADVTPVIDAYQKEGFGFLVMKLLPDQGVQAMRPVRVTMSGASLSLPLRMASVGTGALVGITVWVVSDGRYEPQNFPSFHIDDSQLVWDFKTSSSNYTTLRAQAETASGNRGWEIESSIDVNEQLITNAIYSGGASVGGGVPGESASAGDDYLPIVAGDDGGADGGVSESADQVRDDDVNALLAGMTGPNVRVTRMRSDISHAAMTADFALQASSDQTELSNLRVVTQVANANCPIYDSDCDIVAYGSPAQATAAQNGHGGGCVTSARSKREPPVGVVALVGLVAVTVARIARRRKKR